MVEIGLAMIALVLVGTGLVGVARHPAFRPLILAPVAFVIGCALLSTAPSPAAAQVIIVDKSKAPAKSGPVCGGVVGGKPQPSCSTNYARYEGAAVGKCPAGSIFDVGLWQCWSCPRGFERTAAAVDTDRACGREATAQERQKTAQFARAALLGPLCPPADPWFEKSFYDSIRGGECWACPKGYATNVLPRVDAWDKCTRPSSEELVRPTRMFNTPWPTDCKPGQFFDTWDGGACWKCPSGFVRTAHHVNSASGCSKVIPAESKRATVRGIAKCEPGTFQDPRNGGECWKCPTGYDRTVHPVDGALACETTPQRIFSRATFESALSCPSGQDFDFIGVNDQELRNLKGANMAPPNATTATSGTCWSCPAGTKRTTAHVKSAGACTSLAMKWYTAPYPEPGLFGIPGADEVVLELLRMKDAEGNSLVVETAIKALAEETKAPLAQLRKDLWEEIRSAPENSAILASIAGSALIAGLETAADQPAKPEMVSQAQRNLIQGFAKYMTARRTYIAQDALAAYDTWAYADEFMRVRAADKPQHLLAAFGTGVVPPDFYEVVHAGVFAGLATSGAVTTAYTALVTNKAIANKIFPFARKRVQRALQKAAMKGMEETGKQLIQTGAKTAGKAILKASAVAKAIFSVGPQIIITVAIEILAAEIEKQIAIADARPKILAQLAQAQRLPNFAAMIDTPEGTGAINGYWSLAVSGNTKPSHAVATEIKAIAEAALGLSKPAVKQLTDIKGPTTVIMQGDQVVTTVIDNTASLQPGRGNDWEQIPGRAHDIALATDGTAWVIGDNKLPGGFGIYFRGTTAKNWGSVSGGAKRIAVAGTRPWLVNDGGLVFELAPSGTSWTDRPVLAGGKIMKAIDIGASAKGVWALAEPTKQGNSAVYRWTGKQWQRDQSAWGTRITVDADGNPWLTNSAKQIFALVKGKWQPFNGAAQDIAVDAFGAPVVVDASGKVMLFDTTANKWMTTGRDATAVAIGGGEIWHLGPGTEVYRQK